MKNIVKFQIVKPTGNVTVDAYNPLLRELPLSVLLSDYLPYTRLFEHITIKNFTTIPMELLNRLTTQYLHGAKIEFDTPKKHFSKVYSVAEPTQFYTYKWTELDLSAPIPRSLAEFRFEYNGKETTYLDAISSLHSTHYLPNEIWTALDKYSQSRIDTCRQHNRGRYAYAEEWYKTLMRDCMDAHIKVYSPNKKTYFEVIADIDFEKDCADARLQKGLRSLSDAELAFLNKYAKAYGVEVPTFKWRINSRKTEHGYTQEPERVYCGMSHSDIERITYDPRNINNLPKNIRDGLRIQEYESNKLLRDAYYQLLWIMKNLKDDGLMNDYHRCPKCHQIYREYDGCECGYCQPIEFVQADNLLYGNSSSYEDYEHTHCAYDELSED